MLRSSTITLDQQAASLGSDMTADEQAQGALLEAFLATAQHFFRGFGQLFAAIVDPRRPEFITYSLATLLFTGVLMYACRLGPGDKSVTLSRPASNGSVIST